MPIQPMPNCNYCGNLLRDKNRLFINYCNRDCLREFKRRKLSPYQRCKRCDAILRDKRRYYKSFCGMICKKSYMRSLPGQGKGYHVEYQRSYRLHEKLKRVLRWQSDGYENDA